MIELAAADYVDNPTSTSVFFDPISFGWGPDNNSLFVSINDVSTTENKPVAIVLINLDGDVLQDNLDLFPVAWSPDGRRYVGYKLVEEPFLYRQVLNLSIDFSQGEKVIIDSDIDEEIWYFLSVFWMP